jgi:deoxyhypusine monooxygenase
VFGELIRYAGFKDESELLKHELAYVLGQTRNLHAVGYLENVLDDPNQQEIVRHEAAEALGALGQSSSLPLLEKYLHDPSQVIRETCELAVARIKWSYSKASREEILQQRCNTSTPNLANFYSAYTSVDPAPPLPLEQNSSPDLIAKLQSQLNDQSLPLFQRYRAMFRLRDLGTRDAVLALATGLKDPSSALFRHEVAYVFGQICSPYSVPALMECLRDTKEMAMVRHEAAEALGSIGAEEAEGILLEFEKDQERIVRESCVVARDMWEFERSGEMEYAVIPGAA